MTAPQFPAAWGQPPAPVSQAPGYPPQQQAPAQYAPQPYAPPAAPMAPPYPAYPQAPQYDAIGAPPPAVHPYAVYGQQLTQLPQYAQQAPQGPPPFQPAPGTLDEYMNQRPAGAQFWKFPQPGHVNIGMVERDLRDSDVTQVQFNGQPVRRKDGSVSQEKSLSVPLVNPDGTKSVMEFRGHQRTAFEEAVAAGSGGARRLPEGGSMIRGEFTHTEPSRGGGSPKKIIRWSYVPADQVQGGTPLQEAGPGAQFVGQQYQPPTALQQQAPPAAPQQYAQPQNPDPAYAAWLASQGQAPQPAAPAQAPPAAFSPQAQQPAPVPSPGPAQAPPAAFSPQAQQPAPVPSPGPAPAYPQQQQQSQGAPPPQQYVAPGLDPQAQALFGSLMGGAPAQ